MSTMHPVTRSRALQSALVGAGLLGAVGVSLGLAGSTQASSSGGGDTPGHRTTPGRAHHQTQGRSARHSSPAHPAAKPRVTAPKPSPTQATSSGS